jgi:hypothetical protein
MKHYTPTFSWGYIELFKVCDSNGIDLLNFLNLMFLSL